MAQGGAPGHVSLEYQFASFVSIAYLRATAGAAPVTILITSARACPREVAVPRDRADAT
jgi:hypothetical protein